jgi:hypothetical protein
VVPLVVVEEEDNIHHKGNTCELAVLAAVVPARTGPGVNGSPGETNSGGGGGGANTTGTNPQNALVEMAVPGIVVVRCLAVRTLMMPEHQAANLYRCRMRNMQRVNTQKTSNGLLHLQTKSY